MRNRAHAEHNRHTPSNRTTRSSGAIFASDCDCCFITEVTSTLKRRCRTQRSTGWFERFFIFHSAKRARACSSAKNLWLCDPSSLWQDLELWHVSNRFVPNRSARCKDVRSWQHRDFSVQTPCGNNEQTCDLSVWQCRTTQLTEAFVMTSARERKGSHSIYTRLPDQFS